MLEVTSYPLVLLLLQTALALAAQSSTSLAHQSLLRPAYQGVSL